MSKKILLLIDFESGIMQRLNSTLLDIKKLLLEKYGIGVTEQIICFSAFNISNNIYVRKDINRKFGGKKFGIPIITEVVPVEPEAADDAMFNYLINNLNIVNDVYILTVDRKFRRRVYRECQNNNLACYAVQIISKASKNIKIGIVDGSTGW